MIELPLPRYLNRRIWRAIVEFGLIEPGDRILVGFSGGKDSALLLYALRSIQAHNRRIPFSLEAVTLDEGWETPVSSIRTFSSRLGVGWHLLETQIAATLAKAKDPCAQCSYFRRGAICRFARENGFNRVALGHHLDDAIETFLMSILYGGQIQTFSPRTQLEGGLSLIRPLVYLREKDIRRNVRLLDYEPAGPRCPYAQNSQRKRVKDLIAGLSRENRFVYTNIVAAMRGGRQLSLWPPAPGREELRELHRRYFGNTLD